MPHPGTTNRHRCGGSGTIVIQEYDSAKKRYVPVVKTCTTCGGSGRVHAG